MRKIIAALLCFALLIGCIPVFTASAESSTPQIGEKLIVTGSNVNLRTEPNTDCSVIRRLSIGTEVILCGDYGEWANVRQGDDTGWISTRYLKKASEYTPPASLEHASILNKLDELRVKFPDGKYWNHVGFEKNTSGFNKARPDNWTDSPCPSNGGHTSTAWCNGQCDGWARKIGQDLFGATPSWDGKSTKWERKYTLDGLCIGDLIRFGSWHTVVVTGFTDDSDRIIISDCNWQMNCNIDWDRSFSLSRYAPRGYYVDHYKGNTLNREAYLNPASTTTTTTTTTTTATTTTTTVPTTQPTTSATVTPTLPTTVPSSPAAGSDSEKTEIVRLGGNNRFQTAALISTEGWNSARTVMIASSAGFADALAGVPLAHALNAPILLVNGSKVDPATAGEIKRLGAHNAIILGGTSAVSSALEAELTDMGMSVTRICGDSRFETAEKIADAMNKAGAVKSGTAFFVNAYNYPDALAVSSIAAITGSPILYAPADGAITDGTVACAEKLELDAAVIIGGKAAINDKVQSSISSCGLSTSRVGGANRYETAVKISEKYAGVFSGKTVCFATGRNFPDALAGGVLAAKLKAPVVLVDNASGLDSVKTFVGGINPGRAYIFGGTAVVDEKLVIECLKG